MSQNCVFCREIEGSKITNFARLYPEIPSRVIGQTDSLIAFPCIGQLVRGHFLVVPRKHECTFSAAISNDHSLIEEFRLISKQVHRSLGISENESLFFEHGAVSSTNGGCGIYHAHIHVLPNVGNLNPLDIFDFNDASPRALVEDALQDIGDDGAYVMVGTTSLGFFARALEEPLASQTLRKSVARKLSLAEWDWRTAARETNMLEILAEANT